MGLLVDLTVIFAIAAVVLYISAKLNIPTVVGLLLSGLIAGPSGFGWVQAQEQVEVMAEIGILLLLFTIGLEFSLEKLLKSKVWIVVGGGLQVLLTTAFVFLISFLFNMTWQQSLFAGFLFSMSSTAIVLHMLQEKGSMDSRFGRSALSILIFQDIAIIPMILLVPYLTEDGGQGVDGLIDLGKGVLMILGIIFLARTLVPQILRSIVHTRNQDLFLVAILVICFSTAFITYELGLKLALGAFLAGLIISESEFSYDALSNILPLKKIFTSIFFISIGMLLNLNYFVGHVPMILGLALFVMMLKVVVIVLVGVGLKISLRNAFIVGLSLCQVGEFAFVLANAGADFNILTYEQNQVFLAVSIFSMAVSPFIIDGAPKMASWLVTRKIMRNLAKRTDVMLVGEHQHGCRDSKHLVIIGYGINGEILAHQAKENGIPYSIIELNAKVAEEAKMEGEPMYPGDARNPEILQNAAVERARTIVIGVHDPTSAEAITIAVRKLNPHAHIIVRSQFESEIETLTNLGANEVVPERKEAAKKISERALLQFIQV